LSTISSPAASAPLIAPFSTLDLLEYAVRAVATNMPRRLFDGDSRLAPEADALAARPCATVMPTTRNRQAIDRKWAIETNSILLLAITLARDWLRWTRGPTTPYSSGPP
jgi:hypothetical protein